MRCKPLIFCIFLFLMSLCAEAQQFVVLPDTDGLVKGRLSNGVSYYIFENKTSRGIADFALVQKVGRNNESESEKGRAMSTAKQVFSVSERVKGKSLQNFLISKGAVPPENGFISVSENSTVYHINDVPVLDNVATVDSTLMVLFDIIDRVPEYGDPFVRRNYSTSAQAIIVSGDVNAGQIEGKLKMLAMMVPSYEAEKTDSCGQERTVWRDSSISRSIIRMPENGLASVRVEYSLGRMPLQYVSTVFPVVSKKYIMELGAVVERRVRKILQDRKIPYASIKTDYSDGIAKSSGGLAFMEVSCADADLPDVVSSLGYGLASVSGAGILCREQRYAFNLYAFDMREWAINPIVNNSVNVGRAVSAFMYGTSLASPSAELEFLVNREVPDSVECRFLNDFSKAIVNKDRTLYLAYRSDAHNLGELETRFDQGWKDGLACPLSDWEIRDLPAREREQKIQKVKFKSSRNEPVSGGEIWMASNGMKIIYKKMPVGDQIYASLVLNQGYASMKNLSRGEGAMVTDLFRAYDVAGMTGNDFRDVILADGVKVDYRVDNFRTSISGVAHEKKASELMEAIWNVAYGRTRNPQSEEMLFRTEPLNLKRMSGTKLERLAIIDSIMCPTYKYTPYLKDGVLTDNLVVRTDDLLEDTFSNVDDGIWIIIADLEESELKKMLSVELAGFQTSLRLFRTPSVDYQPQAGNVTYTVPGRDFGVDVAVSTRIPLTAENYVAAQVVSMILRERLITSLSTAGADVDVVSTFGKEPQERLNLMINVRFVDENGFLEGTLDRVPVEVLGKIRGAVSVMPDIEEIKKYMPLAKAQLKGRHENMSKYPRFHVVTVMTRYLEGKDFFSKYNINLDAVSEEKVLEIYRMLNSGSSVEYIVGINKDETRNNNTN